MTGSEQRHDFEAFDGSSGMVCTAMVTLPDGTGDSCGRPAQDDVHYVYPTRPEDFVKPNEIDHWYP